MKVHVLFVPLYTTAAKSRLTQRKYLLRFYDIKKITTIKYDIGNKNPEIWSGYLQDMIFV